MKYFILMTALVGSSAFASSSQVAAAPNPAVKLKASSPCRDYSAVDSVQRAACANGVKEVKGPAPSSLKK